MRVGYMMMLANLHEGMSDGEMLRNEMRIAAKAEEAGFDIIWCPEHHFESYSMAVDNLQILTWLAAKTDRIQLGSAALILPWWTQPIRLAERIVLLDAVSNGRYVVGFGRGLARKEFEAFGIPIEESRSRFDEMAKMLVGALQTGYVESEGPHFPQARTEIRPRLSSSFQDRIYSVAMSSESAKAIAQLDTRMMTFVQFSMERLLPNIEIFRNEFQRVHGKSPQPTLLNDQCYCHEDEDIVRKTAHKYLSANYISILQHYEFMEDYHKELKGYETYGESARFLNELGLENAVEDYISHQAWGTPDQILQKLDKRRNIVGDYEWNCTLSFGGLPYDSVEYSMKLIGEKVIPELRDW